MRWQHKRVRRVVTLGVQLVGERDIVVTSPESGFSITYRKDGLAPMLVAIDDIGRSSEPSMEVLGTSMEGCSSESPLSRLATFLICLAESNLPACASIRAPFLPGLLAHVGQNERKVKNVRDGFRVTRSDDACSWKPQNCGSMGPTTETSPMTISSAARAISVPPDVA